MQIRPLFRSAVGAPPPSSGVHCAPQARMNAYTPGNSSTGTCYTYERAPRVSILIIIYAVARGSDIIIVRGSLGDSIDEDYAGYSTRETKPFRGSFILSEPRALASSQWKYSPLAFVAKKSCAFRPMTTLENSSIGPGKEIREGKSAAWSDVYRRNVELLAVPIQYLRGDASWPTMAHNTLQEEKAPRRIRVPERRVKVLPLPPYPP